MLAGMLAAPAGVYAQARPDTRHGFGPTPNLELYGGYSYVFRTYNPTPFAASTSGMNGWDASFKVPVFGTFLGVKGDVSGFYRNDGPNFDTHQMFFLLGPQVSMHLGRSTLFAHGMVGSAHLSSNPLPNLRSDNSFALAVGGGLDAGFSRWLAWRVTGDYYNTHYEATNHNISEIRNSNGRISTGPVIRF